MITVPETVPDLLAPMWRHWNVGHLYRPAAFGNARLETWDVSQEDADHQYMRAALNPKLGGRWCPPGHYAKLELYDPSDEEEPWQLVMSDTPDEMADHFDVLMMATGRVLIHGLGLGCVLNCLLHKPDVTDIVVVEVNGDVIKLVGPTMMRAATHQGKSLTIHQASCVDPLWPPGARWNYVWHDIWSTVNADNLTDDAKAEHGISYARLHRMFGHRCDRQGSWALREARWQREVYVTLDRWATNWCRAWASATRPRRLEMLADVLGHPVPAPTYLAFIKWSAPDMYETWDKLARRRKFKHSDAEALLGDHARRWVYKRKAKADLRRAARYASTQVAA